MQRYKIDQNSVEMADLANRLRVLSNAADGHHAQQTGGTYGAASEALTLALTCGIAEYSNVPLDEARAVAGQIAYQCVDNGEPVIYQIEKVFNPGSGYHGANGVDFEVVIVQPEVIVDRVTGRPATWSTPDENRTPRSEWLARMDAALEEEHGGYGGVPTAGEGCGA